MAERSSPLERPFHGLWAPMLTPLNRTFGADHDAFGAHGQFLLDNGCHGLAPFGTTGEANSFSVAERRAALDALVASGIAADVLMPGTGCCAEPDTVELTRHAVGLGCRGVLMLPPFYYKAPSEEGLYRAFASTIDRVADGRLRVLLYHIPPMSQIPIPHTVIRRLCDAYPGVIAGLKDSSGDWEQTRGFIEAFPDLDIFPGSELLLLDGLRAGGAGCISATANINPAGIRKVFDAFLAGDAEVDELQHQANALRLDIQKFPVIAAMKRVISSRLKRPEWAHPRPPLLALDDASWQALAPQLAAHGIDL